MEKYLESILAEPFTIMGRRLKPLTLGHLLLLNRLKVCPVTDNDDLLISVLICSTDSTTLDDIFEDRLLNLKLRWWRWRLGKVDWLKCHELWAEYFTTHLNQPSWATNNDNKQSSSSSGTPFLQSVRITLLAKCGYSPSDTLNISYAQCMYDFLSYHELEGNIDILDQEERTKLKELADTQHDQLIKKYFEGSLNDGKS